MDLLKTSGISNAASYDPGSADDVISLHLHRDGPSGSTLTGYSLNGVNFVQDIPVVSQPLVSFNMYATAGYVLNATSGIFTATISSNADGNGGLLSTVLGLDTSGPVVTHLQLRTFQNATMPTDSFNATVGDVVKVIYESNGGTLIPPLVASNGDTWDEQVDGNVTGAPLSQGKIYALNVTSDLNGEIIGNWLSGNNSGSLAVAVFAGNVISGSTPITINGSVHGHTSDNLTLSARSQVLVSDSNHNHVSDNIKLTGHSPIIVNGSAHAGTSDQVALVAHSQIVINDSTHAHTSDNLIVTPDNPSQAITIQSSAHSHTSDNLTLAAHSQININNSTHSHTVDNLVLTNDNLIVINDSSHGHSADIIQLSARSSVVVNDSFHAHTSTVIPFKSPTSKRTIEIKKENRTIEIGSNDRQLTISKQSRVLSA